MKWGGGGRRKIEIQGPGKGGGVREKIEIGGGGGSPGTSELKFARTKANNLDCVNSICLVTLQYIYGSRCLKKIPNFAQLKSLILDEQNVEKYIATKNNNLAKHMKKWQGF